MPLRAEVFQQVINANTRSSVQRPRDVGRNRQYPHDFHLALEGLFLVDRWKHSGSLHASQSILPGNWGIVPAVSKQKR